MMKRVLIAHQSTIPHYRVAFYEAVEDLKPSWWDFRVVFDADPGRRRRFFIEPIEPELFGFKTLPTRTFFLGGRQRSMVLQTFLFHVHRYDLVVLEDALRNFSYPLARACRGRNTAVAYWGHGRDFSVARPEGWKKLSERIKRSWARRCDGYFAYTDGVARELVADGVDASKIHVLNNTIDIRQERISFDSLIEDRDDLRRHAGLSDRKVLLFVGRLNEGKRLGFLGEAVRDLRRDHPEFHLVVIGGGEQASLNRLRRVVGEEALTYCGVIVERARLAEWFSLSDAYVHPGDVGLGIVQALCYDLTPVVVDRPTHNPEYEYLSSQNSVIAPVGASPREYAAQIARLCSNQARWEALRAAAWPSISHLTIENMASRFVDGVSRILRRGEVAGRT
jgi:glycosyltransferase involved in cell wall biosynthesis